MPSFKMVRLAEHCDNECNVYLLASAPIAYEK